MKILDTKILPKEKREKQNTLLELLLGKKALKEILDLDLSSDEYKYLVNVVVAAATGREPEEIEKTTEKK